MHESISSDIVNYALQAAIEKDNYDIVKDCIDHQGTVTVSMLIERIKSFDSSSSIRNFFYEEDLIFKLLLENIPSDAIFNKSAIYDCARNDNMYYLEIILETRRYQYDIGILYLALLSVRVPQSAVNLLIKHGFTPSLIKVMNLVNSFDHRQLSRLRYADTNLNAYQPNILAHLTSLCNKDPPFELMDWFYPSPGQRRDPTKYTDVCRTLCGLIQYLRSNPHAASNFMMAKYTITHLLTDIVDISTYIWKQYLACTVGFHSHYINCYQQMLNTLESGF